MQTICKHYINQFHNQSPTNGEINKYRLYKCEGCGYWFSLLGEV